MPSQPSGCTSRWSPVARGVLLTIVLSAVWMLWSGHTEPWMVFLGAASVLLVVCIGGCFRILDSEGVPAELGIRPFVGYGPWLLKEIAESNLEVSRRILHPALPIRPMLVTVRALARTSIGRVIFANSITLTPGTVSVDLQGEHVRVHALSLEEAAEDVAGEMNRRVARLERGSLRGGP